MLMMRRPRSMPMMCVVIALFLLGFVMQATAEVSAFERSSEGDALGIFAGEDADDAQYKLVSRALRGPPRVRTGSFENALLAKADRLGCDRCDGVACAFTARRLKACKGEKTKKKKVDEDEEEEDSDEEESSEEKPKKKKATPKATPKTPAKKGKADLKTTKGKADVKKTKGTSTKDKKEGQKGKRKRTPEEHEAWLKKRDTFRKKSSLFKQQLEGPYVGRFKNKRRKGVFGFIASNQTRDLYGQDVFIHRSEMDDLRVGDDVQFYLAVGPKGLPRAMNVTRIEEVLEGPFEGNVSYFDFKRGRGHLHSDAVMKKYGKEVYCHRREIDELQPGDDVKFYITFSMNNSSGIPHARKVTPVRPKALDKDWKGPYNGTLARFDRKNHFGFITGQETWKLYNNDVFVFENQLGDAKVGDKVKFYVATNEKGQPQAKRISKIVAPREGPFTGAIKTFNWKKGYGFIMEKGSIPYGKDVFIGHRQVSDLKPGDDISFYVEIDDANGKPQARRVQKIEDASAFEAPKETKTTVEKVSKKKKTK
eukprot:gnl/TRDRNA2_/TRDRNA2_153197_c0_seq8.p1 gnl/TRDRNA2_/TRDRNA2_153197_c0~~gnl/TRDRNA2_/TRDRNA2_153197_c0_seq8.p1  ORF type:complete len:536 (-),score=113.85 gnl/TRDRNA2_/TRDRNA2_153197_c0_seq8:345-1952(-)